MVLTRSMTKKRDSEKINIPIRKREDKTNTIEKDSVRDLFRKRNKASGDGFKFEKSKRRRRVDESGKKREVYYIKFDSRFRAYLDEVEKITGVEISYKQRKLLQQDIESHTYTKQTPEQNKIARKEFNEMRADLIKEWEKETGNKWSVYKEDVYSKKGKIVRTKGHNYEAHHLVELSFSGRPVWYNLHPARYPDQHQGFIHRKGGLCNQIFS